jgi:hypothetical protein
MKYSSSFVSLTPIMMPGFLGFAMMEANTEHGWSSPPYPAFTTPEPLSITIGLYSPPSAIINKYLINPKTAQIVAPVTKNLTDFSKTCIGLKKDYRNMIHHGRA